MGIFCTSKSAQFAGFTLIMFHDVRVKYEKSHGCFSSNINEYPTLRTSHTKHTQTLANSRRVAVVRVVAVRHCLSHLQRCNSGKLFTHTHTNTDRNTHTNSQSTKSTKEARSLPVSVHAARSDIVAILAACELQVRVASQNKHFSSRANILPGGKHTHTYPYTHTHVHINTFSTSASGNAACVRARRRRRVQQKSYLNPAPTTTTVKMQLVEAAECKTRIR